MTTGPNKHERERLEAAGYLKPEARDGCCKCAHSKIITYESIYHMRCQLLRAPVRKVGICMSFERARPAAEPDPC
jgi:hypothetical protein